MSRRLPEKDVVIVGLGWTGSIMALELADAGLDVVAIERGPWRNTATDYPPGFAPDELCVFGSGTNFSCGRNK